MRAIRVLVLSILLTGLAIGQQTCLQSPPGLPGGNGQSGAMFDVQATASNVVINTFNQAFSGTATTCTVEVYAVTGGGSFVGLENNPAAWTLLASVPNFLGTGPGVADPLGLSLGLVIPVGTTQGFYITCAGGASIDYTNGVGTPGVTVVTNDPIITIFEGVGIAYPFSTIYTPRNWNGEVCYTIGGTPPTADWMTNTPPASLQVDTAYYSPYAGTVISKDVVVDTTTGALISAATGSLTMSTSLGGALFDMLINGYPTVAANGGGGINLGGGNLVNMAVASGFTSLNSGATGGISPQPFPGSSFPFVSGVSFTVPFVFDVPFAGTTLSIQGFSTDPTVPWGFTLTAASQIDINLILQ